MSETAYTEWSGKTDGTPFLQRALVRIFRYCPREIPYAVMALVVPFYMLFNRKGYRAIYRFFHLRMGYAPIRSFLSVYANHFRFGQVVLDRFAAFAGKKFHFDVDNQELFDQLAAGEKGFVQLSSHVGCYELAGYHLTSSTKQLNALVFAGETATVMQNRQRILAQHNMRMVPVASDMSHLFILNQALDEGQIVSMPADRLWGSNKRVRTTFFGAEASFPRGAFALAKAKEVPLLAVFVMKESARRYHIFVHHVANVEDYAAVLEQTLRRYPTQWFNYYDFWQ